MAMATGSSGGVQSDINVTPMIDVLLVLLIIFMITQPLSRMALDVQVPPPDTPQTNKTPPSQIVLELFDDGGYAINGQPVPKDQLDTQMHAIYDQRPAKLLFVSIWLAFGIALFLLNRERRRPVAERIERPGRGDVAKLLAFGVAGGVISSVFGSGLNDLLFCLLTLHFRVSEKVATPTSVVSQRQNASSSRSLTLE